MWLITLLIERLCTNKRANQPHYRDSFAANLIVVYLGDLTKFPSVIFTAESTNRIWFPGISNSFENAHVQKFLIHKFPYLDILWDQWAVTDSDKSLLINPGMAERSRWSRMDADDSTDFRVYPSKDEPQSVSYKDQARSLRLRYNNRWVNVLCESGCLCLQNT